MQALVTRLAGFLNERLNPMLIRELRQGMRSKIFLGVFLLLQGAMMFSMLLALAASFNPHERAAMGPADFFFWLTVLVPLLLTLPLKGSVAVSSEVKSGTLELLFLTRLSAWTTVMGKWTAIIAQSLLVVSALLPYTFMRYYLGGIDILSELGLLFQALLMSGFLAAALIAMSSFSGGMVKGAVLLICFTVAAMFAFSNEELRDLVTDAIFTTWQGPVAVFGMWAIFIIFFLQLGAAKIAPPAENYALRKRLLGLVFLLGLPGLLSALGVPYLSASLFGIVFSLFVALEALLEQTIPLRSLYHRSDINPVLGGIVRYFFSPGWASGIFFFLLIALIDAWIILPELAWRDALVINNLVVPFIGREQSWILLLNLSAIFIFPNAVAGIFRRSARCSPAFYLTCTLGMVAVVVLCIAVGLVGYTAFAPIAAALPHGQPFALLFQQGLEPVYQDLRYLTIAAIISGVAWIICIGRAIQEFRNIASGEVERAPDDPEPQPGQIPSMV